MSARAPGWPAVLRDGAVSLRPFRRGDARTWSTARLRSEAWLTPWEPSLRAPYRDRNSPSAFGTLRRRLAEQARAGTTLPFAICLGDAVVGQLTVGNIVRGSFNSGYLGYWVEERYAGQGICPTAVALAVDHCFGPGRLHRVEANIRPENVASRRVVEKLGFRQEGMHLRYLSIDGAYRDHVSYALTAEDVPAGLLARWHAVRDDEMATET